jgi:hypothetical protein
LDFANCSSVTWAPAICWSTCLGPSEKSVAAGGALSGTAWSGFGAPGVGGGWSGRSGVTCLSLAAAVSGGGLGGGLDSLGRGLFARADLALHLPLDRIGLARVTELVGLVEVLRGLFRDRVVDRLDERGLVEVTRLRGVHLLRIRRLALGYFVVRGRLRGTLRGRRL